MGYKLPTRDPPVLYGNHLSRRPGAGILCACSDPGGPLQLVHVLEHLASEVPRKPGMIGQILPHHGEGGVGRLTPEKRGEPGLEKEDPAVGLDIGKRIERRAKIGNVIAWCSSVLNGPRLPEAHSSLSEASAKYRVKYSRFTAGLGRPARRNERQTASIRGGVPPTLFRQQRAPPEGRPAPAAG